MTEAARMEFDLIVVGSGAGGLTAAVVAAHEGLTVLLIEKAAEIGGTTAISGGGAWIPNNHLMADVGLSDSVGAARRYLHEMLGEFYEEEKIEAYLNTAPEMLHYMEAISHIRFNGVPFPDYSPDYDGAAIGRSVLPRNFDGAVLGSYLKKLRPPLRGFALFRTMQVEFPDVEKFKNAFRSWDGFLFSTTRMLAFASDWFRFGKGTFLANGNALVGRLLRSALDKGVEIWTEAPAIRLLGNSSGVTGVTAERAGREFEVLARKGVILATGGFGANLQMRSEHIPMAEHHFTLQPDENSGDGIRLGLAVGGVWGDKNASNATWAPTSVLRDKHGRVIAKYPHFGPDRGKPGSIIVGLDGKRFANEAEPYQDFVNTMHARGISSAWLVGDSNFLKQWGMGLAMPRPMSPGSLIRAGYLIKAPTIRKLAIKIGVDEAALENTVSSFNAEAVRGRDLQFNRGGNIYDHVQGDPATKPNPNLGPLLQAPFYAVALHPGDAGTALGLKTTIDAQVQCRDGSVIPGLYAVGLDQNSVFRGVYPGGGSGIGPTMTFAYRAALSALGTGKLRARKSLTEGR